eukprot:m.1181132 g.1181132  ORF g.1181132 m.1181132 type:complete len:251 (+) comp24533_c0_seq11:134-886(+)
MIYFLLVVFASHCGHVESYFPTECNYTVNTDYGCTVGSTVHVASKGDCCTKCLNTSWCLVGVYQADSSKCFLKGGILNAKSKSGVEACRARNPTPPAPPFDCAEAGSNCAQRLGATHWNPCYFRNASLPVLLDGAQSVAGMGSRVIKVALFEPATMYPFNSPLWPAGGFADLVSMAAHEYYASLFAMESLDTYAPNMDFDAYCYLHRRIPCRHAVDRLHLLFSFVVVKCYREPSALSKWTDCTTLAQCVV